MRTMLFTPFFNAVTKITLLALLIGNVQISHAQGPNECPEELFPKYDKKARLFGYANWLGEYKIPAVYLRAARFDGKYARVQVDKKMGIINCEGFLVVQANYDEIGLLTDGRAFARNGENFTFLNATGRGTTNEVFQDVAEITDYNLQAWVKQKGKWALFDKETARLRTQPFFDAVTPISDSATIVRQGTRYGIYNNISAYLMSDSFDLVTPMGGNYYRLHKGAKVGVAHINGRLMLKPVYDSVKTNNGFVYAYKQGRVSLIDNWNNKIAQNLNYVSFYNEKFAVAQKDSLWSFLNNEGRVIGYNYTYLTPPVNGYALGRKDGKYGFVQVKTMSFLNPPTFTKLTRLKDGTHYLAERNGKLFFINPAKPNEALESQKWTSVSADDSLKHIRVYQDTLGYYLNVFNAKKLNSQPFKYLLTMRRGTGFVSKDSVWGIWTTAQDPTTVKFEFDTLLWTESGKTLLVITQITSKRGEPLLGIADLSGNTVLKPQYEAIYPVTAQQFKVKKGNKWGVVYRQDVWGIEPRFASLHTSPRPNTDQPDWPAIASYKGKSFLINEKGEQIGTSQFNSLAYVGEGLYLGRSDEGNTLLNFRGQIQKNAEPFDSLGLFEQKLAPARQNGKWGFVTIQGRYQIKPQYEEVYPYTGRSALVKMNGKWGAIDRSNNWIMQPVYDDVELVNGRRRLVNR